MPSAYTKLLICNYQNQELNKIHVQRVTVAQLHSVQRKLETTLCLAFLQEKQKGSCFSPSFLS